VGDFLCDMFSLFLQTTIYYDPVNWDNIFMVPNFSQNLAAFGSDSLQLASELLKLKREREEKQQLD
jgi:uncharacterized 2Fe-2S/4Fe-4S cluster protein (DUF4445 family)